MTKPDPGQDRIQREIEELLDKLDTFVPEERLASKIRNRRASNSASTPSLLERTWKRVSGISLGQMILVGLALMLFAFFLRGPLGAATSWIMVAGLIIAGVAFVLSVIGGGSSRTVSGGGGVEKRWRGQVIDYSEPTRGDRILAWFKNRRRR